MLLILHLTDDLPFFPQAASFDKVGGKVYLVCLCLVFLSSDSAMFD